MAEDFELVIIGAGPAGLAAGLYASWSRLNTILIERAVIGGQIANADRVENYPGFPDGIGGFELSQLMQRQAIKHGLEIITSEVVGVELDGNYKVIKTRNEDYRAGAVIIATGSRPRKLGVPGEERLLGKGVSYCATCDGPLFADRKVAVVGGGDAAVSEAIFLTKFASKVILVHRRDELRASKVLQEIALAQPKLEFVWDTVVEEIKGEGEVAGLRLRDVKTSRHSTLEVPGVFIYVGLEPSTDYLKGMLNLDETGHIVTNELMETSTPGIFAAGDVRHNSARQAITAAGDGATAALSAEKFLRG